jgi:hypothetical protein
MSQPAPDVAAHGLSGDEVLVLAESDSGLVLGVWEPTGQPRVDAVLDLLDELDDDVHEHARVFDAIHQGLRETLTDLDATTS